ncbi:MAG TPA: hypothetical protein VEC12_04975, partial [Bacteroidia bacterium]|nr:hypothetical protein [Bacteroidia bacterium]
NARKLGDFIELSMKFINEGGVSITKTRTWYITGKDFQFVDEGGRPAIKFAKTDIKCVAGDDSSFVYETGGTYYMDDLTWQGNTGMVYWERAGIARNVCFAELKTYSINMENPGYTADSVKFMNSDYLDAKIWGKLEERTLEKVNSENRASYPRFVSHRKDLILDNFITDLRYVGGFAQYGAKTLAYGDEKNLATFRFFYKNRIVLQVEGEELFVIKNEKMVTDKAGIRIFMDSGTTIYHPQVNFSYLVPEQKVTITRGTEGLYRAPFLDDFHNIEILADIITWNIKEPKIDIKMILKEDAATFSSNNYFKEYRYEKLQGMLAYNPLQKLKQYCDEKRVKEFYLKDYSKFAGSTVENLIPLFITLHDGGYLKYNMGSNFVQVYEKTFNYVNSHFGRTDYDVISFQSIIGALPNATINLENFDMKVEGVPQVRFSDSQNVYVIPTEQRFTVKKNRQMQFEGKVRAGRFEFFGKGFDFSYMKFTIDMNNIDSLRFFFPDENNNLVKVNSVLQDISGTLFIDQQYNKSGLKDYSDYPIFKSTKGSKVYYDYPSTFGGIYNRNDFYFTVDPFTIDSLDNFTKSGLKFDGTFTSAGIFPEQRETLTLQDDYSLGFIKPYSKPMYKGIGQGNMTVNLSNRGLFGQGEISFAGSVTKSEKFTLFPDSTTGYSMSFDLAESTLNPGVKGKDVYTHWEPYNDRMSQFTTDKPMSLYSDASFFGEYILGKKGSKANGDMHFNDAILGSKNMSLGPKKFDADTSTLVIKSIDPEKYAFRAVNVKANVDMAKRVGDFKAIGDGANSEFPYNMYKGSLNEFKWDIKAKTLRFTAPPGTPDEKSYFVSTADWADSLTFISKDALYDLNTYVLYANKVPFVNVADARIFPDSNKLIIRQAGNIDPLKKAKVLVDTTNKWHSLYDCNLNIHSRKEYKGDGKYDYVDRSKRKNTIFFKDVIVDKFSIKTIATGYISIQDSFTLSPYITYRGDVTLMGVNRGLDFNGFFMAQTGFVDPLSWWVRHRQVIAPDSVFLWVNDPKNEDKKELYTGFAVANDTALMYTNIFSRKRNYNDGEVLNVNKGVFFYDDKTGEFIYGDSAKIYEGNPKGNYFAYDTRQKTMYGEGNVNFAINTNEFKITSAGNVEYSLEDSVFELNTALLFDFPFPEPALKHLVTGLNMPNIPANAPDKGFMEKALAEMLDEKSFKRVQEGLDKDGTMDIVNDLAKTMFITDAQFVYNPPTRSFRSDGTIGLSNIGKDAINKRVDAKIEFERKRSGDEVTIYFEDGNGDWYYFNFVRTKLFVLSSNDAFMTIIKENLEKFTKDNFTIGLGTDQLRKKFLRSFGE